MLPLALLIVTNGQNSQKFQTSLYKILRNHLCDAKGLETRFHFSGHTIGFHLQTRKFGLLDRSRNAFVKETDSFEDFQVQRFFFFKKNI